MLKHGFKVRRSFEFHSIVLNRNEFSLINFNSGVRLNEAKGKQRIASSPSVLTHFVYCIIH